MSNLNDTMFARPPVFAHEDDISELKSFAEGRGGRGAGSPLLREEVKRMAPVKAEAADFVRLGSSVHYRDLRSKRQRQVRVVRPHEADQDMNWISVLSPIGAALIGLRSGTIIRWADFDGHLRAVKVLRIE